MTTSNGGLIVEPATCLYSGKMRYATARWGEWMGAPPAHA